MDRMKAIAAKVLADYKEHYDFPPQGESHMEDCIMDALQSLESVRSEALRVTEEQVARAARVIANSPLIDHPKLPAMNWRGFARQILEAALSPARQDVHSTELRK